MGATSLGGGVVGYLRTGLVDALYAALAMVVVFLLLKTRTLPTRSSRRA